MAPRTQFPYPDATSSPTKWFAITPDDDNDLANAVRAIWVGTGGALALRGADGEDVVIKNIPNGTLLIVSPARVLETGTVTAADLVGFS